MSILPSLSLIRKERKRLKLTQEDLALLAGVSQGYISKLEMGTLDPSYGNVGSILEALVRYERRDEATVSGVECGEFVCVQVDTTLMEAVELMRENGYNQLTVLRGKRIVGSITENTVLDQLYSPRKPDLGSITVGRVMDEPTPQVDIDPPLTRVIDILKTYPAIIIQKQEEIKGILTRKHILDSISTNNEKSFTL